MGKPKISVSDIQKARRLDGETHVEELRQAEAEQKTAQAKESTDKPTNRPGDKPTRRPVESPTTGQTDKLKPGRREQVCMTFYMDAELRQAWRRYEAEKRYNAARVGQEDRTTFQGTVEAYLRRLLREYLK